MAGMLGEYQLAAMNEALGREWRLSREQHQRLHREHLTGAAS
jgi:hypothetical protein